MAKKSYNKDKKALVGQTMVFSDGLHKHNLVIQW